MTFRITDRTLSRAILCGLFLASGPLLAGVRVVSGQWEHTMTTDGETQSRKVTACLSADEAKGINGDSKAGRAYFEKKQKGPCKIKTFEIKGNTLSYALSCGDRTIENKTTFHGETSEGVSITKALDGTHTMHVKSRRLGPCP
jgi:Protein of unknown function (DUF3617)